MREVCRAFAGVENDANWGASRQWPTTNPAVQRGAKLLWTIWRNWWALRVVSTVPPGQRPLFRQKIRIWEILGFGKPWSLQADFRGDYLDVHDNPNRGKYARAVARLLGDGGDSRIMFAAVVDKINSHHKAESRVLVLTDLHLYKYSPRKYKIKKAGVPLAAVRGVALSADGRRDTFVHVSTAAPERDLLLRMASHDHLAEFVGELIMATGVPVTWVERFEYNNSRPSPVTFTLEFVKGSPDDPPFVKGKHGVNTANWY